MIIIRTMVSFLKDREYRDLLLTTSLTLAFGTVVYHFIEGWSWINALYFSVITLTTIGYGDFSPATDAGKLFTIFYIIIGIGIILSFINTIYNHYTNVKFNKSDNG
jgi:voltage-gated potassium channel Kch